MIREDFLTELRQLARSFGSRRGLSDEDAVDSLLAFIRALREEMRKIEQREKV